MSAGDAEYQRCGSEIGIIPYLFMIQKTARKPLKDPAAERLVQNKANWNKEVSGFINDLIHLKKMMNGWPSKFYKERSSLSQPIPADPATIIGSLAGDFQDIAQRGNSLVQEQMKLVQERQQRLQNKQQQKAQQPAQPEAPAGPATPPPAPGGAPSGTDLTKQLAASFETKYGLVAEGSNPISRFFTRLLTPTMGTSEAARIRKYRMSLLDECAKAYKDMGKLQVEIVKPSKESLHSSNNMLHEAWEKWNVVYRGYQIYVANMPKVVADTGGDIQTPKEVRNDPSDKAIKNIEQSMKGETDNPDGPQPGDYEYNPKEGDPEEEKPSTPKAVKLHPTTAAFVSEAIKEYMSVVGRRSLVDPGGMVDWNGWHNSMEAYQMDKTNQAKANNVIANWSAALQVMNSQFQTNATSMKDLAQIARLRQKAQAVVPPAKPLPKPTDPLMDSEPTLPPATGQIEVLAQAFLKKWLGKTWHQMSLFDKTSAYRLDIFKMAGEIRVSLNQIMDSLEKGMDLEQLSSMTSEVHKKMTAMRGMMRALHLSLPKPKPAKKK